MPKIQPITNQVSPVGPVSQARASASAFGAVGGALASAGQAVVGFGKQLEQRQKERERFEADKFLMKTQAEWIEKQQENKLNAPDGAEGFAEQFTTQFDDWRSGALEGTNFRYNETNQYVESHLDRIKLGLFEDSIGFEAAAYGAKQKRDSVALLTQNQNIVRADPSQLETLVDQQSQFISSMPGISNQERGQLQQEYHQELYNSAIDGQVSSLEAESDKITTGQIDAMIANVKTDYWKKNTGAPDYDSALTRLERLREQVQNRDSQISTLGFEEDMRQLNATGVNKNGWTEEKAVALGNTPLEREKLAKRFNDAKLVGEEMTRGQDTSFADDQARLVELEAGLGTTDQFDASQDRLQAAQRAYTAKAQAFAKDPAGYTITAFAGVQGAWTKFQANPSPATFQNFVVMSTAQQKKLMPGATPSIVPDAMVADVADKLSSVGIQEGGASKAGDTLGALQSVSGRYYPQVLRDLYKKKALDEVQFVAGNVAVGRNPHWAQELLKADAKSSSDWAKLTNMTGAEDLYRRKAMAALEPMRRSLVASGGEGTYAAQVEALTRLGLYNKVRGADVPISDLADKMFLGEYNFKGDMRIPKDVDAGAVWRGANRVRSALQDRNIVSYPDYSGRSPEAEREDYLRAVQSGGTWVTNSNETGARLLDDIGRPVFEEILVDGKKYRQPVTLTWDELQGTR